MAGVVVNIEDADDVLNARVLEDVAGPAMARAQDDSAEAVLGAVRPRARRHRKSGEMERRLSIRARGDGFARQTQVHAGGKVAHLVIGGTAPHLIRARGHALAIGDPPRAFAASVHHPGTHPDPFFAAGVADATGDVSNALDDAGGTIVRELARRLEG